MIGLDTPIPSAMRPGATWPSVVAAIVSTIGVRVWIGTMPVATCSRVVCEAMTPSVTSASAPEASAAQAMS